MNEKPKLGIKEQIQSATSIEQVHMLVTRVGGFQYAHPSTIRKCGREAKKRIAALGAKKSQSRSQQIVQP